MKKRILSIVVLAAMTVVPMGVFAQVTTTTNAQTATIATTGSARIVMPLTFAKVDNLEFGTLFVEGAGSIAINAESAATTSVVSGSITIPSSSTSKPAKFTIVGQPDAAYTFTVPTTVTLNGPNSGSLVITTSKASEAGSWAIPTDGNDELYIGGSFTVAADQRVGDYSATFNVSVNYN